MFSLSCVRTYHILAFFRDLSTYFTRRCFLISFFVFLGFLTEGSCFSLMYGGSSRPSLLGLFFPELARALVDGLLEFFPSVKPSEVRVKSWPRIHLETKAAGPSVARLSSILDLRSVSLPAAAKAASWWFLASTYSNLPTSTVLEQWRRRACWTSSVESREGPDTHRNSCPILKIFKAIFQFLRFFYQF